MNWWEPKNKDNYCLAIQDALFVLYRLAQNVDRKTVSVKSIISVQMIGIQ